MTVLLGLQKAKKRVLGLIKKNSLEIDRMVGA